MLLRGSIPALPIKSGAEAPDSAPRRSYSDLMPDMLVTFIAARLNRLAADWSRKRSVLRTPADLEERDVFVRQKFLEMLHPFPPRCPLDAVTVEVINRGGYRIENVMFQSRPNFWVTGNLYVPKSGNGPFPAIISPCGHYPLARMLPQYQSVYLNFVLSGFVVLGYDPIGQGERRQYWNPETNITEVGGPTTEHSMPGQLLLLLGENLTQYRVWDGMRGIDYLLTRAEVDPNRIGCAGHSGGGTLTKFITLADPRVRCAAIIEGGTANRWPVRIAPWEPLGPSDVEQNVFRAALYGVDNADMHKAIAPRPLLVGIEHYSPDFDRAAQAIHTHYRQLGAGERFATVASDDPHAWTTKLRLAATDWFCRWFYHRQGPAAEPRFETEDPEALYCTPDGSVRYAGKGETVFSLILNKQADLPPARPLPKTRGECEALAAETRDKLRRLLRYHRSDEPLEPRHLVTTPRDGYKIVKDEFLSEPGIYIPAWIFLPEHKSGVLPTILYVSDEGMEAEGMEFEGAEGSGTTHSVIDSLVRQGNLVVAVDVRGIGQTRSPHCADSADGSFPQLFNVETALAYMAWFMDESLLGMRVQDIIRSIDFVASLPEANSTRLRVIGKGRGGLWCLYAAALDSRIRQLICVRSLLSYKSLTKVDRYLYAADVFIPGVLLELDLPQVAAAIAGRPLALISPLDPMMNIADEHNAAAAYQWTQAAYNAAGCPELFRVESRGPDLETAGHYLELFRAPDLA